MATVDKTNPAIGAPAGIPLPSGDSQQCNPTFDRSRLKWANGWLDARIKSGHDNFYNS